MKLKHQTPSTGSIRRNDVRGDTSQDTGYLGRTRVTRRGVEISLPVSVPTKEFLDTHDRFGNLLGVIIAFFSGGIMLLVFILMLSGGARAGSDEFGAALITVSTGLLFIGAGLWGLVPLRKERKKTLRMVISADTLTTFAPNRTRQIYALQHLRNFRPEPATMREQGKILVEHDAQTIELCQGLNMLEAQRLINLIAMVQKFSCLTVERIIFGVAPNIRVTRQTLQNPDVSTLTFPFVRLKKVLIYTETYDFNQVERFLTYAVNYVGQDYLKAHVEVFIYGEPEQFHANLLNSFSNLCKRVHVG